MSHLKRLGRGLLFILFIVFLISLFFFPIWLDMLFGKVGFFVGLGLLILLFAYILGGDN